jgi:hypothetical protein
MHSISERLLLALPIAAVVIGFWTPVHAQVPVRGTFASPLNFEPRHPQHLITSGFQQQTMDDLHAVTDLTVAPYKYTGILYITLNADATTERHCTAEFVAANVLLTAAHCVGAPGGTQKYLSMRFVQADKGNNTTDIANGTYTINCTTSIAIWQQIADPFIRVRYDYALLQTNQSTPDRHFLSFGNLSKNLKLKLLGYPAATGSPGNTPMYELINYADIDVLHPKIGALGSDQFTFTEGISGGAWIDYGTNNIVSINSSFDQQLRPPSVISPKPVLSFYGPSLPDFSGSISTVSGSHTTNLGDCM